MAAPYPELLAVIDPSSIVRSTINEVPIFEEYAVPIPAPMSPIALTDPFTIVTERHTASSAGPIPGPLMPPMADSAPNEFAWIVMFEFIEHPIPLALDPVEISRFDPVATN
jgi:hypothetical protein